MFNQRRRLTFGWVLLLGASAASLWCGCQPTCESPPPPSTDKPAASQPDAEGWRVLFDGKTLANWKVTDFGGQGEVTVKNGQIILGMGDGPLTGITWAGPALPKMNYEVTLEAMRLEGSDFFCGLTVPHNDSAFSLICGGWGGGLVGISSLDGFDASENETTKFINFESNRWYRIHVRVTEKKIEAWIDDNQVVDCEPGERKVDVRIEVEPSKPFGIAAYRTKAALRDIRVRPLSD